MIDVREAKSYEAEVLSNLAMRSKAYWGYSQNFLEACSKELLISEEMISSDESHYEVAEDNGIIVGFYALGNISSLDIEVDFLFVEPKNIGTGLGRILMELAKKKAKACGGRTLIIQGDPNAEKFYLAMGAKLTGQRESTSVPGRYLPTFSIDIVGDDIS